MVAGIYATGLLLMLAAGVLGVAFAVGIDLLDDCFSKLGAGHRARALGGTTTRPAAGADDYRDQVRG